MRRVLLLLWVWSLLSTAVPAEPAHLPNRWRFKTGDGAYATPAVDDGAWKRVWVPAAWADEGFQGYHGIAWYRIHFDWDPADKRPRTVVLGRIIDTDETFLNGTRIGRSGQFPPHPKTAWDVFRKYRIPAGLLRRHNVLAVRVLDMGGYGGIDNGPVGLYSDADMQAEFHPQPGPRSSLRQLVTTNGLIAAVYDVPSDTIERLLPHIFQSYDQDKPVRPMARHLGPVGQPRPRSIRYLKNTHVIEVSYGDVTVHYFAPFSADDRIFYAVVSGPASPVAKWTFAWDGTLQHDDRTFTRNGTVDRYFRFSDAALPGDVDGQLLDKEVVWMQAVHARCHFPSGLRPDEQAAMEQSVSVLKMAQVSQAESIPRARGQILASLPPGVWNIAWVRDGYYSTLALNRLGLYDEARRMLAFELEAESAHYVHFTEKKLGDVGVGVPYQVSVCRYFGAGKEEADGGDDPNIEIDGFGLVLVAFSDYVERSGDKAFYDKYGPLVKTQVADALLHCIDPNGLVRPESGPWERHHDFKQFAWTSMAAAAGLRDFARLQQHMGTDGWDTCAQAGDNLQKAILAQLVTPGGWIKANAESKGDDAHDSYDAGTFEGFALGLFDADLFRTHLAQYDRVMRIPGPNRGFARINKGDWYESPEWIMLDLRAASAMLRYGQPAPARTLADWITGQTAKNYNLLPEMYTIDTWAYDGSIPMVGFGSAAYVLTMMDLYNAR